MDPVGSEDLFVAGYGGNRELGWLLRAGGTGGTFGSDVAVLDDGAVLVAGYFSGQTTFGAGEVDETVLDAGSAFDLFVARYEP